MKRYKRIKALSAVLFILAAYGYQAVASLPDKMVMVRGEEHIFPSFLSTKVQSGSFRIADTSVTPLVNGNFSVDFSLLGILQKRTDVSVVEPCVVTLGGNIVGIKLYMEGALVIGMSEIPNSNNPSPGKMAGILVGDRIIKAGDVPITSSRTLEKIVDKSEGKPLRLTICREDKTFETEITPVYYEEGSAYKLGLWVRDSTAGIGTVTFSLPNSGNFAALGHGIEDADTGMMVDVEKGSITDCEVTYISKGERGSPGELRGAFTVKELGKIKKNDANGIYGTQYVCDGEKTEIPIAVRTQVKKGEATLYSDVDGEMKGYKIEVERVLPQRNKSEKSMVLRVTDERLLELTGGIVQGMSGSPLVQNGKLIGAVTHVFVNDPTRGYGIYIENMLAEAEKMK